MKLFDHLKESKCISNNQNLKMKVAFLSLSENKISAEQANYLGKLPLTKALTLPTYTSQTQNSRIPRAGAECCCHVNIGTLHALSACFVHAALNIGHRR